MVTTTLTEAAKKHVDGMHSLEASGQNTQESNTKKASNNTEPLRSWLQEENEMITRVWRLSPAQIKAERTFYAVIRKETKSRRNASNLNRAWESVPMSDRANAR